MATMISLSFYAFSRAVIRIPLAVSYAIWEGLGLFLIAMAGIVFFGEYLNLKEIGAIGLMMVGLMLITFDSANDEADNELKPSVEGPKKGKVTL